MILFILVASYAIGFLFLIYLFFLVGHLTFNDILYRQCFHSNTGITFSLSDLEN